MTALVLLADGFEDLSLFVPLLRLKEDGWAVRLASPLLTAAAGEHGDEVVCVDLPDRVQDADHVRVRVRGRVPAAAEPGEGALFSAPPLVEGGGEQPAEVLLRYARCEHMVGSDVAEDPTTR